MYTAGSATSAIFQLLAWVSWNRLQYLDLEARYQYRLSDRWALGAAYAFEFIHSSEPRPLWSFRNGLMISTSAGVDRTLQEAIERLN